MDVNVTRSLVTHRRLVPTVTDATNELRKAIRRGTWQDMCSVDSNRHSFTRRQDVGFAYFISLPVGYKS
jgi:hypothetical protein